MPFVLDHPPTPRIRSVRIQTGVRGAPLRVTKRPIPGELIGELLDEYQRWSAYHNVGQLSTCDMSCAN